MKLMPATLDHIRRIFHLRNRPTYLGRVACEIGHSIKKTQEMFDVLVEHGEIRQLTPDEKKVLLDVTSDHDVWMLVGSSSAAKSHI